MLYVDTYYGDYYTCAYKKLLYATHQLDERTGEMISVSDKAKLFYLHMLQQYLSYRKEGKLYYETQEQLGKQFGVSDQQAYRVVCQLKNLGLISVLKRDFRRYETTVYKLEELSKALRWVNCKLEDKPRPESREKITQEEFLIKQSNKRRWRILEAELREEKRNPYIDHKKARLHVLTENREEYKEFLKWREERKKDAAEL